MQFAFTEEQELLRREARDVLVNGGWGKDEVAELGFLDRAVLYDEAGRAGRGEEFFDASATPNEQLAALSLEAVGIGAKALELALEVLGSHAQLANGGSPDDGYWQHNQLRSRGNTIEAGTSEILRNIIAERVLGLPRSR